MACAITIMDETHRPTFPSWISPAVANIPRRRIFFAIVIGSFISLIMIPICGGLSLIILPSLTERLYVLSYWEYWSRFRGRLITPAKTFVISLPRRKEDRMPSMEVVRVTLGLDDWQRIDATDVTDRVIDRIIDRVRLQRSSGPSLFQWPSQLASDNSEEDLWDDMSNSDTWESGSFPSNHPPAIVVTNSAGQPNMTVAMGNNTILAYEVGLPDYKILTRGKIACWHSHYRVLRAVAEGQTDEPSLILEDDVDMEQDIEHRLASVWPSLPPDWDIVFLGHCWSDETIHAPLRHIPWAPTTNTSIHPSNAPLCTHAYMVSTPGARRILGHLTYPPFAYSRAVDHAFAHLIHEQRIHAFSLVPSVVVQRKSIGSDVRIDGFGSAWKEGLTNGILGTQLV